MTPHERNFERGARAASFWEPIHVIGVGALGSATVGHLVREGFGRNGPIHVWDGDMIEKKNLINQAYETEHLGLPKVEAIARQVLPYGVELVRHREYVETPQTLSGIVFLCVDRMDTRKNIVDASIRGKSEVALLIEMRSDAVNVLLHAVVPSNEMHMRYWDRYWYPDEEAQNEGGCGGFPTIGAPIADLGAYRAVQELKRYLAHRLDSGGFKNQVRLKVETFDWDMST